MAAGARPQPAPRRPAGSGAPAGDGKAACGRCGAAEDVDDGIDAAELPSHRVGNRRAALDSGDIRSHKPRLRWHILGSGAGKW